MNINRDKLMVIQEVPVLAERLKLRKLKFTDADDMFEYTSDIEVCKFLQWGPHSQIEETKDFISRKLDMTEISDITFAIELIETKKMIGVVRLYNFENEMADISYIMNKNYWKKGYMTEAVNRTLQFGIQDMGLQRIYAYFAFDNSSSENVMIRSNMTFDESYLENKVIKGRQTKVKRYFIKNSR